MLEKCIEPTGLRRSAWKTVENETALAIGPAQPLGDHGVHQVVRNELAARHDCFRLGTNLCAFGDTVPQNVSRGDLRDVVAFPDPLGLRALPGARRAEQNHGSDVARGFLGHRMIPLQFSHTPSARTCRRAVEHV